MVLRFFSCVSGMELVGLDISTVVIFLFLFDLNDLSINDLVMICWLIYCLTGVFGLS